MRLSAKSDYAIRALVELAARGAGTPVPAERLAEAQHIPVRFLLGILGELRNAGVVTSRRGADGGYLLARPAGEISLADVIRAVEGPLAQIGDLRPDDVFYTGAAEPLRQVWVAVRASLRAVLEHVSLAHIASGQLPRAVTELVADPDAWVVRFGAGMGVVDDPGLVR